MAAPYNPPPSYTPAPASFPKQPPQSQQQSTTNTTVMMGAPVAVQPVIQAPLHLRDFPVLVTCPNGGHQVTTKLSYQSGTMTIIVAVVLFLFFFPLAFIPFFMDSLKDVVHTCPIDGTVIGVYRRI